MKSYFYGKIMEQIEPSARWENFGQEYSKNKKNKKKKK